MVIKQTHSQAVETLSQQIEVQGRSVWQDVWRRFKANRAAMVSTYILAFIIFAILFGPLLGAHGFDVADWPNIHTGPNWGNGHYLGTDSLGRDLYMRVLVGGRISILVGILGALVAVLIGTLYGATSGFIGGNTDRVMMRVLEVLSSMPFMFFVILLVTFFGRNIFLIFVAIGCVSWLDVARIVRGQTLSLKGKAFIEAAQVCGSSNWKIITRHIIPNVLGVVVVYATLLVPGMILFESFLSFLGLGVQEPMTSWGALLQEGAQTMEVAIWQLLVPASFMVLTLFCFNYLGDGLRDALDPKQH